MIPFWYLANASLLQCHLLKIHILICLLLSIFQAIQDNSSFAWLIYGIINVLHRLLDIILFSVKIQQKLYDKVAANILSISVTLSCIFILLLLLKKYVHEDLAACFCTFKIPRKKQHIPSRQKNVLSNKCGYIRHTEHWKHIKATQLGEKMEQLRYECLSNSYMLI